MPALYDFFEELKLSCCIICETWFYDSPALENLLRDARTGHQLEMINYVRKRQGKKNRGGGVTVAFNPNVIQLKKYNTRTNGREIVTVRGKIPNNTRPIFIIAVYISTRLNKRQVEAFLENISAIILKIKSEVKEPYIVLGGDMNRADMTHILVDFPDLAVSPTPPTRGDAVLDVAITSFREEIKSAVVRPPLTNDQSGSESDHMFLHYEVHLEHTHEFTKEKRKYRPMPQRMIDQAAEDINKIVWENQLPTMADPEQYVREFHKVIVNTAERSLPWKVATIKSTDSPWITEAIRRQTRIRNGIFRAEGRSRAWKDRKKLTRRMHRQARKNFYDQNVEAMKQPGALPFQAIKRLKDPEAPKGWELGHVFPGETMEATLEKTADYFSEISQQFRGVEDSDIPEAASRPMQMLDVGYVAERMRLIKKPKSYTSIDIPPAVFNKCIDSLATATTPIFNLIRQSGWWPEIWKIEEVTIIPKTSHPTTLDETRNISCTSIFSKLAEEFMLQELQKDVRLSECQFGGRKGCGTEHLLAELSDDIAFALEDNRACVNLMSLDYSKAFNRMAHDHCLRNLAKQGATKESLAMVFAFLKGRSMKIKNNGTFSTPRPTPGGAPQGTKSGNFLFTIAADDLGPNLHEDLDVSALMDEPLLRDQTLDISRYDRTHDFSLNVGEFDRRTRRADNPLDDTAPNPLTEAWTSEEIEAELGVPERWRRIPIKNYKYVDDQTIVEVVPLSSAVSSITTRKEERYVHAGELSKEYTNIDDAATKIGMSLNLKKTQLLCVSDAKNYRVNSYLRIGDEIVEGQKEMKILGYILGSCPGAKAQVEDIKRKAARKSWSIRHLKKAAVPTRDLLEIYMSFIRSVIEYGSNIYHGYLTRQQAQELERIQANILKSIYGDKSSYRECLVRAQMPTLRKRRELNFLKFARRVENSSFFRERWLPLSEEINYELRRTNKYKMFKPKCERYKNSPIYRIRETLNDLHRRNVNINVEIIRLEEEMLSIEENDVTVEYVE